MKLKGAITRVAQMEDGKQFQHVVTFPIRVKMEPFDWSETSIELPMITEEPHALGTELKIEVQPNFS